LFLLFFFFAGLLLRYTAGDPRIKSDYQKASDTEIVVVVVIIWTIMVDEQRFFRKQKKELAAGSQRARGSRGSGPRRPRETASRVTSRQPSVGLVSRPLCSDVSRAPPPRQPSDEEQALPAVGASDPEGVQQQQRRLQQRPQQHLDNDSNNNEEKESTLSERRQHEGSLTTLEATRVQSEMAIMLATAEKDSFVASLKRSRIGQCSMVFGCILIVGLIVGLSLAFIKSSDDDYETTDERFFNAVGAPLMGKAFAGRYGSSISMNRDGTRMAVADSGNVYVYELVLLEDLLLDTSSDLPFE
jgi:hypothetical protein